MRINIKRLQWLSVLTAVVFIATGCQTTGKYVRWYAGPVDPKNTALLKVQRDVWEVVLTVDKIDGQPLAKGKFTGNNTSQIELLRGRHDLEVSYRDSNDNHSLTDAHISFIAEAGKVYELCGAPGERSFGQAFSQTLFMQHWYWTVWIIDAKTQKVVAGTPRKTPLHWYE